MTAKGYELSSEVQGALAALEPKERAFALAQALWQAGWSLRKAAAEAGIDHTSLWRRIQASDETQQERIEVRKLIEPLSVSIAMEAGRQTLEALHEGEVGTAQLPIVYGIGVDKLQRLHQMSETTNDASPLTKLFDLLAEGGRLAIEGPDGTKVEAGGRVISHSSPEPPDRQRQALAPNSKDVR